MASKSQSKLIKWPKIHFCFKKKKPLNSGKIHEISILNFLLAKTLFSGNLEITEKTSVPWVSVIEGLYCIENHQSACMQTILYFSFLLITQKKIIEDQPRKKRKGN